MEGGNRAFAEDDEEEQCKDEEKGDGGGNMELLKAKTEEIEQKAGKRQKK